MSTPREFLTTRWSIVLAAQDGSSRDAMERLCRNYWYPLYAYVRRAGDLPEDAQDLTQEFFARLLAKSWLDEVKQERGRFLSWLLAAMRHFLTNEWHRSRTQKRGGGAVVPHKAPVPLVCCDEECPAPSSSSAKPEQRHCP